MHIKSVKFMPHSFRGTTDLALMYICNLLRFIQASGMKVNTVYVTKVKARCHSQSRCPVDLGAADTCTAISCTLPTAWTHHTLLQLPLVLACKMPSYDVEDKSDLELTFGGSSTATSFWEHYCQFIINIAATLRWWPFKSQEGPGDLAMTLTAPLTRCTR